MITLKHIAEQAGVAVSSVSDVLHRNDSRYNLATRNRIKGVAQKLGYRPNALARSMAGGKTKTIGVVGAFAISSDSRERLAVLTDELQRAGYKISIATRADGDAAGEREHIEDMLARRVEGLLIFNDAFCDTSYYESLQARGVPLVLFGSLASPQALPVAYVDTVTGMYEATRHLLTLGHRDIAYAVGKDALQLPFHRVDGFRRAMEEASVPVRTGRIMDDVQLGRVSTQQFTRTLLRANPRPTAIMYADDEMALVGLHTILEMGLRVPEDVSVVGFDDLPLAQLTWPELTTVRQPRPALGRAALELLLKQIRGEDLRGRTHVLLPTELVLRQSTRPSRVE